MSCVSKEHWLFSSSPPACSFSMHTLSHQLLSLKSKCWVSFSSHDIYLSSKFQIQSSSSLWNLSKWIPDNSNIYPKWIIFFQICIVCNTFNILFSTHSKTMKNIICVPKFSNCALFSSLLLLSLPWTSDPIHHTFLESFKFVSFLLWLQLMLRPLTFITCNTIKPVEVLCLPSFLHLSNMLLRMH